MSVPKKRRTSSSRKRRASHRALLIKQPTKCPNCGVSLRPHHGCTKCGLYRGRDLKSKITKPVVVKASKKATATKTVAAK